MKPYQNSTEFLNPMQKKWFAINKSLMNHQLISWEITHNSTNQTILLDSMMINYSCVSQTIIMPTGDGLMWLLHDGTSCLMMFWSMLMSVMEINGNHPWWNPTAQQLQSFPYPPIRASAGRDEIHDQTRRFASVALGWFGIVVEPRWIQAGDIAGFGFRIANHYHQPLSMTNQIANKCQQLLPTK